MEYQRISGSDFLPTRGDHAPVEIFGSGVRKDMPEVRSGGRPEAAPNSSDSDAHRCHQHLLLRRSRQTLSTPRSNGAGGPGPGPPAPFDRGECMPLRAKRSSSASARLEEVSGSPPFSLCGGQRKAGLRFWSHWGLLALTSTRLGLAGMTAKTDLAMALPGPPHKSEAWILGTSNFARPQRCWADAFRRPSHRASAPFVRPPPTDPVSTTASRLPIRTQTSRGGRRYRGSGWPEGRYRARRRRHRFWAPPPIARG